MMDLKKNMFLHGISERLRRYYISCLKAALPLAKADASLMQYIDEVKNEIHGLRGESDFCLLDIFYHMIAHEPFKGYLEARLQDNVMKSRAARNLSELSRMLSRYSFMTCIMSPQIINWQCLRNFSISISNI